MTEVIELPNGDKFERLYKCADCTHTSDTHDSRQIGAKTEKICENCGEPSLMLTPGERIEE